MSAPKEGFLFPCNQVKNLQGPFGPDKEYRKPTFNQYYGSLAMQPDLTTALLSSNEFGTYFGISQSVFDRVWKRLRAPDGNSVVYVSMEIGADPDVFYPIKKFLQKEGILQSNHRVLRYFLKQYLDGPRKIPNYSGGLGVLAGDTLKSFADLHMPVIAVSLLYRGGYFSQFVDSKIGQIDQATHWTPENTPTLYQLKNPEKQELPLEIEIPFLSGDQTPVFCTAQVWMKLECADNLDYCTPQILLDYDVPGAPSWVTEAAQQLYSAKNNLIKANQRRMLGSAVLPIMQTFGLTAKTIHLNEQHGVTVTLHLIQQELENNLGPDYAKLMSERDILAAAEKVAQQIIYTIHTPVKAGHDRFSRDLYTSISRGSVERILNLVAHDEDNPSEYNFTTMAMRINRSINSVSRLHRDVTKKQFPDFAPKIKAITNGVHHITWTSDNRAALFDSITSIRNWRNDPGCFSALTNAEHAHLAAGLVTAWHQDNQRLIAYTNRMLDSHRRQKTETWIDPPNYLSHLSEPDWLQPDVFTIGFARRFSTYKRADLIFDDIPRLAKILVENNWKVNFLFAGKAHPEDEPGKMVLKLILDNQEELYQQSNGLGKLVFIPNYDMYIAKLLVSGAHSWLNCPKRPLEASGTSGMKAAMNGVPNISVMDGWWVEGFHDGATGWKFGYEGPVEDSDLSEDPESLLYAEDSDSFYRLLPRVLETFYSHHESFLDTAVNNLKFNVPIFNTHRMASEYIQAYNLPLRADETSKISKFQELYHSDIL